MTNTSPAHVVTDLVRLSYPSLFEKTATKLNKELKYRAMFLFSPTYDLASLNAAMMAAATAKWGSKIPKLADSPVKACTAEGFEGWHQVRTKSGFKPTVVDQLLNAVIDPDLIYAGCWVKANINAYCTEHESGKNFISFGLNGVQFARHGERLDGRKDAKDLFEPIAIAEGDALAAGTAGTAAATADNQVSDASSLFGG